MRGESKRAFLVSGTEVLFLPSEVVDLESVTVFNGWFPNLSYGIQLISTIANAAVRLPFGRHIVDALSARTTGGEGGPGAVERARTLSHVVAIARDGADDVVGEVHLEGPSPYTLTAQLMAWAAHRLVSGDAKTPGVVGPVQAFGLEALTAGCSDAGLDEVAD